MPNNGWINIGLGRHAVVATAIILRRTGGTLSGDRRFGIGSRGRAILAMTIIARRTHGAFADDGFGTLRSGRKQTEQ